MSTSQEWRCQHCHEAVPDGFDVCWNCGTDSAGVTDPTFQPAVGFTPQCEWCGYLLIGISSTICPECGVAFDPKKKDTIGDVGQAT
jgi:RNA polymerase subunit RPABC4/transcription elongation factor Spt4